MRDVLIASGSGVILGIIFYFLAVYQVSVRAKFTDADKVKRIKNRKWLVAWIGVMLLVSILFSLTSADWWTKGMYILIVAMSINVAAVDISLRRIPNALLLGMMLLKIADVIIKQVFANESCIQSLFYAILSMLAIYVLCTLPNIVGINMGAGDIKYCSVLGFVFGIKGFALAMVAMSVLLIVYVIYLKATKKGGMKTVAPLGPFLSAGSLFTMMIMLM